MSRILIRLASLLVPGVRRQEWLERWDAEVDALGGSGTWAPGRVRFALGALPDAALEFAHGWREGWSLAGLAADVRDAWRMSRHTPAATLTTVLIVGVGTTAAASIFSLADALLVRPPAGLSAPDRLFQIGRHDRANFDNFSYPNLQDLRAALDGVVELAGYTTSSVVIGAGADADVLVSQAVTANYFSVLGVELSDGPGFSAADDLGARDLEEAVVSDTYWRDHATEISGRGGVLIVNARPFRVVGVAPPRFQGVDVASVGPSLWTPLGQARRRGDGPDRFAMRDHSWIWIVGRVAPGHSMAAARSATVAAHGRLAETYASSVGTSVTFAEGVGLRPGDRAEALQMLAMFSVVATLLLLVAVANVATVQFARATRRRSELVLRAAMGASRFRLMRGLLVEQLLLAAAGAAVAVGLTYWTTVWLRSALPYDLAVTFGPDLRVLSFSLLAAVAASAAMSFWPLLRATDMRTAEVIRTAGTVSIRRRTASVLIATQLALSTLLLGTAGLFLRSVTHAAGADTGFDARDVTVVSVREAPGMATGEGPLRQALSARLAAVPGVTHVGLATVAPIIDSQSSVTVMRPDAEYDATGGLRRAAVVAFVDREYFEVLRLPIAEGRSLSDADVVRADGETPAVISSALANALWPAGDALGERFVGGTLSLRVVGVTAPVAVRSVREADATALWLPIANSGRASTHVLVRTAAGRGPSAAAIRGALAPFAGEFMVRRIRSLEGGIATSLEDTTLAAEVTLVLGGAALVMAAVGLFGVVSSQVARRRREFGVRIALGASPGSVVWGVLASALSVAAAGAATGYGTLVVLEPQLRPLLFRTEAMDVSVAAGVAGGLLAVTIAAAWLPARRAAESDPLVVLRSE